MAKVQISEYKKKRIRRKGVHAKTKTSKNKNSVHYKQPYASQGRYSWLLTFASAEITKKISLV